MTKDAKGRMEVIIVTTGQDTSLVNEFPTGVLSLSYSVFTKKYSMLQQVYQSEIKWLTKYSSVP